LFAYLNLSHEEPFPYPISTNVSTPSQTGLLLPKEGIFLGAIENIGRTLLLVDFGKAGKEYIFNHEIETQREN